MTPKKRVIVAPDVSNALDKIREAVEKSVKGATVLRFDGPVEQCPSISSGSFLLDRALGIGGYPQGRIVEIFGPESSGKTTLALHAIACAQEKGGMAAIIDAEHALDINYARNLGVQVEKLLVSQPDCGEQALDVVESLIRTTAFGPGSLIVIDSVAALTPRSEIEGEMGDSHMGVQARLMSQGLRKLTALTHKTGTLLVFINQLRMKIGVVYGSPEVTTGGNALKFYASVRLDIRRTGSIKDSSDRQIANQVRIKVVKNKLAPPFQEVTTTIRFGQGVDRVAELVELASTFGLIQVSGSWYSYKEEKLAQGKENVIAALQAQPAKLAEIEALVREILSA